MDYLNSGVVWARNNKPGKSFVKLWGIKSVEQRTDQGALNSIVAPTFSASEWRSSRGTELGGVLILDCAEWNSWHPPFTGARIAHFKRGIRAQAVNYL